MSLIHNTDLFTNLDMVGTGAEQAVGLMRAVAGSCGFLGFSVLHVLKAIEVMRW